MQGTWADIQCTKCKKVLTLKQIRQWSANCKQKPRHKLPFCSSKCSAIFHIGDKHSTWKGGRIVGKNGYAYVRVDWDYIEEHRFIVEKILGHSLNPKAVIHHINFDKTDNRKGNLFVCDQAYHKWFEHQMAILYAKEKLQ